MINRKKISLVLPCRNEGNHLHEVMKLIPKEIDEILIVSNRSTDNTVEVAKNIAKKDKRVVFLEDNRTLDGIGYGYAHMTGIANATGDYISAADGDGTYPINQIPEIVAMLIKNKIDFVSCNRYPLQDGVKIPFKLKLGVNLLNWEIRLLYGIPIKDALSGMWVFDSSKRQDLHLTMGDWNLSPQIKINAAKNREIKFQEFSIPQEQRLGETKQNYMKTGMSHALWILRNRFTAGQ